MNYESAPPDTHVDTLPPPPREPMSRKAKIISWVVSLLVLAGIALAVSGIVGGSSEQGQGGGPGGGGGQWGQRGPITVGLAQATAMDVPITLEALGTVTPAATVIVRPQVSGVITGILYREGQMVRKGQVLATIDSRAYAAQLAQAQGAQARDRATLENARLTLQRFRTLLAQDSIARQEVDTQAALVRQLEGTATANSGALDTARLNVGFANIVSPVDGRVGLRVTDVGNYIGAGDANGVAVVTTVSPIDVEFTVPQDRVPDIQERIAANATLTAEALDRTRTNVLARGQFLTLDNRVAVDSGTVRAKARFANADGKLYPSQFVNLRLLVNTVRGAITVPGSAVRQGASGSFVWLLKPDSTVTQRKVTVGRGVADRTVITAGIAVGDRIVTEGGDRVNEGDEVQTPEAAAKAAARPGGGQRGERGQGGQRRGGQGR